MKLDPEEKLFGADVDESEFARCVAWAKVVNAERHRVARDVVLSTHVWGDSAATPFRVTLAPDDYSVPLALKYGFDAQHLPPDRPLRQHMHIRLTQRVHVQ